MLRFLTGLVLAAITFCAVAAGGFFISARKSLTKAADAIASVSADSNTLREHADRVLTEAGLAAKAARIVSDAEAKEFPQTIQQTHAALNELNGALSKFGDAIAHTDNSLNSPNGVLSSITLSGLAVNRASDQIGAAAVVLADNSEPLLREGTDAMHGLEQIIHDPANAKMQANFAAASESLMEAAGAGNQVAQEGRQAFHAWLHPRWPKKVYRGAKEALTVAVRVVKPW